MKLQYLGTAAAEGIPALFCTCSVCERTRQAAGRNIRTRSQALVDDTLLIDFPADTYQHMLAHGLPLPHIRHCLVTHSHSDHWYPADLEMRRQGFATVDDDRLFTVYGTSAVEKDAGEMIDRYRLWEGNRVAFQKVEAFVPFAIDAYTVTALAADHDPATDPVIYLIQKEGKSLLYANDTGVFPDSTWAWLEQHPCHLDFVSLDCTAGLLTGWFHGHMGLDTNALVADRLKDQGLADDRTRWCVHHFSHNCLATYDELVPRAAESGFDVSYDGMTVTF